MGALDGIGPNPPEPDGAGLINGLIFGWIFDPPEPAGAGLGEGVTGDGLKPPEPDGAGLSV